MANLIDKPELMEKQFRVLYISQLVLYTPENSFYVCYRCPSGMFVFVTSDLAATDVPRASVGRRGTQVKVQMQVLYIPS